MKARSQARAAMLLPALRAKLNEKQQGAGAVPQLGRASAGNSARGARGARGAGKGERGDAQLEQEARGGKAGNEPGATQAAAVLLA
jgi:hypothetical protein